MSRPACSPRHRQWCSRWHADLVTGYRDARDARDALRESSTCLGADYAAGGTVAAYQLEDAEFNEAFPPVTFREWLLEHARANREEAWA